MKKLNLPQLLKILVSFGMLIYLFSLVEFKDLTQKFCEIHLTWLGINLILAVTGIVISAWKWKILCNATSIRTTLVELVGLYLIGSFYNHFMPTSVGGDVVRSYELARKNCTLSDAFASVFVERYTGLATLLLIVLAALPFDVRFYSDLRILALAIVLMVGFAIGSWMVFSPALVRLIQIRLHGQVIRKVVSKVGHFQEALWRYKSHGGSLAMAFTVSLLFYANAVFITYTGLLALGVEASLPRLFIAVPVMLMLFLLPISLGGVGLQEWAHTFVMGILGVPPIVGVSLGLLYRLRTILFGLVGGLVMLIRSGGVVRVPNDPIEPKLFAPVIKQSNQAEGANFRLLKLFQGRFDRFCKIGMPESVFFANEREKFMNCQTHLEQSERPKRVSSDHLQKAADRFDDWACTYGEDRISPWFKFNQQLAISKLNLTYGKNFLDVGCGTGWAVREASKIIGNGKACGIDISPKMIEKAKIQSEGFKNVDFKIASSESIPFPDETFDAVICTCSFHHYENPNRVLKEFKRIIKREGKIVIIDAARNIFFPVWVQDRLRRMFERSHVKYYTTSEIKELITRHGLIMVNDITIIKKIMFHKKAFTGMMLIECKK